MDYRRQGALEKILNKNKNQYFLPVLKNISFTVNTGEVLGIIGKNGCGKSTLLKIIAKIYFPDKGTIKTNGKVTYLTGLGQELLPKLTMRENIYLIGSLMGLSKKEVNNKFKEIVAFSGLKKFLDVKVEKFSTGMVTRLSFSANIHFLTHKTPDIILLDEVFGGGGDFEFQEKASKKMGELIKGGATVFIVTHRLDLINKYCDRAIWLENGKIAKIGKPNTIINMYKSQF